MKSLKYLLKLLMGICLAACTSAGFTAANAPTYLDRGFDVETKSFGPEAWQKLDIYTPKNATATTPIVVFFYGGRWETGARANYRFVGAAIANEGYIAVIPDYRKYPEVRFPTFVQDGADAVAWVHQRYRGHALHIAGHSAGAHIGALITANPAYLGGHDLRPNDVITDFVGLAGPYDFAPNAPDEGDLRQIFGPPQNYPLMQVTTYITGHEPPMLLLWGEDDKDVGAFNHQRLAEKIRAKGGRVQVITYPGTNHIDMIKAFTWTSSHAPVRKDFFGYLDDNQIDRQ